MPETPDPERSEETVTLAEIQRRHGVSRSLLHTYRKRPDFPRPLPAAGSTRLRFDAHEIADFFKRNPKRQGQRPKKPEEKTNE